MIKKAIYLGPCIAFLISTATPALAKLTISPSISLREEYNDNIFLTRTDREYDLITEIMPALSLTYSISHLDLNLDYGLNFKFYSRHSELNETGISETQTLKFQNQIRPLKSFFIDISDVYQRVPIDIRRPVALENIFVNMTDSNTFTISPYIEYPLTSTLSTRLGYSYSNVWYKDEEGNDSDSHSAFLSFNKQFSSRINATLKYDYLAYRPEKTDDYDRHQGSVGVTYQVTPNFQINGEIGEAKFDYKTAKDTTTTFWNIGTDYVFRITEGTSLGVNYGSSFHDSVTSGAYKSQRLDLRFKTGQRLKISVNPYYSIDKYIETNRKDKVTGIAVDISRALTGRINASLNGLCERQRFLPGDEEVHRYNFGSSLDYQLSPRIITSLGYTHNNTNSNIDTNDFHNNAVWLQARITF